MTELKLETEQLIEFEKKTKILIKKAGGLILNSFNTNKSLIKKDIRDVASETDVFVEDIIKKDLSAIFPDAGFIMEEHVSDEQSDYNWVIDPIDGTKNYVALAPYFFTQLALIYRGKPILSEIYQPVSDQLFSAIKGTGAYLNGNMIEAKCRISAKESIIDVDFRGSEDSNLKLPIFNKLVANFYRVRSSGGMYSPYLVTGAFDAYVDLFRTSKFFDILPRILIFEESGLEVKEIELSPGKKILITAKPELVKEIEKIII